MPDYDAKSIPILDDVIKDDSLEDEVEIIDLSKIESSPEENNFDLFIDDFAESLDTTDDIVSAVASAQHAERESTQPEIGNIEEITAQDEHVAIEIADDNIDDESSNVFSAIENNTFTEEIAVEVESALINYRVDDSDNSDADDIEASTTDDYVNDVSSDTTFETEALLTAAEQFDHEDSSGDVSEAIPAPELATAEQEFSGPAFSESAATGPTPAQEIISLDAITDDIIKQIMPTIEHQLRSLVQQALADKLPEEIIAPTSITNKPDD